eukprot:7424797-Alexandrium_andersonii.AAC.1
MCPCVPLSLYRCAPVSLRSCVPLSLCPCVCVCVRARELAPMLRPLSALACLGLACGFSPVVVVHRNASDLIAVGQSLRPPL